MVLPRTARAERTTADPLSSSLEPHEYFVLSCVDGRLTFEQIVSTTGLGLRGERALERLLREGLVRAAQESASGTKAANGSTSLRDQAHHRRDAMLRGRLASLTPTGAPIGKDVVTTRDSTAEARGSSSGPARAAVARDAPAVTTAPAVEVPSQGKGKPRYEVAVELASATDSRLVKEHALAIDLQRRALWLDDRLTDLDPFTMLELHPTADAAQIRRAFHAVSRKFHPDTYFRQDLGSYAVILDRLFQRTRASYEALKDEKLRDQWKHSLWTEPQPLRESPTPAAGDDEQDDFLVPVGRGAVAMEAATAIDALAAAKEDKIEARPGPALAPDPETLARLAAEEQRSRAERAARDRLRVQAQQERFGDRGKQIEQQARKLKAAEYVLQADAEVEQGRFAAAAAALRLAVAATPDDTALVARAEHLRRTAREKRKEELYRSLRAAPGAADPGSQDPWKRAAMWHELADLDPTVETLSRAGDSARERDPVAARGAIMRALSLLGASAPDSITKKDRGQVHLRAARVFEAVGQPRSAEQELKLAESDLGADHDDVRTVRALLRSSPV